MCDRKVVLLPYCGDLNDTRKESCVDKDHKMNVIVKLNTDQIVGLLSRYSSEKFKLRAVVRDGKIIGFRIIDEDLQKIEIVKCNTVKENIGNIYNVITNNTKESDHAVNMGPLDYRLTLINYKPQVSPENITDVQRLGSIIKVVEFIADHITGEEQVTGDGICIDRNDLTSKLRNSRVFDDDAIESALSKLITKTDLSLDLITWNWFKLIKGFNSDAWMKKLAQEGYRSRDVYTMLYTGVVDPEMVARKQYDTESVTDSGTGTRTKCNSSSSSSSSSRSGSRSRSLSISVPSTVRDGSSSKSSIVSTTNTNFSPRFSSHSGNTTPEALEDTESTGEQNKGKAQNQLKRAETEEKKGGFVEPPKPPIVGKNTKTEEGSDKHPIGEKQEVKKTKLKKSLQEYKLAKMASATEDLKSEDTSVGPELNNSKQGQTKSAKDPTDENISHVNTNIRKRSIIEDEKQTSKKQHSNEKNGHLKELRTLVKAFQSKYDAYYKLYKEMKSVEVNNSHEIPGVNRKLRQLIDMHNELQEIRSLIMKQK